LRVVFELSDSSPNGVFRKTIPGLALQTRPLSIMNGFTSLVEAA
jgi:hypothetical protein